LEELISKDGSRLVVYVLIVEWKDWRKVIIPNAVTKEVIGDTIVDVKFSGIFGIKRRFYSAIQNQKRK
jgi:prolyl oligopeptidase